MTQAPLAELIDVHKSYANGAVAVEGFNATIQPGEFLSLLGPSGCGKSTVLRMVAGLSQPTAGIINRNWERSHGRADQASNPHPVGCVFQEPTLLPWATTWNNVYLPLRLRGLSKQSARSQVDEALERVGLVDFAGAYPRQLSGGMRMRASIARALVSKPRILLLDEPFAALDELTRNRLNEDLLDLWRDQRWAVLFITHSVFESVFVSERVIVMSPRPGRVVESINIELPSARTEETRTSRAYVDCCRQVSQALRQASAGPAGRGHIA
jgi:NitT/TauT family transport system ATP-binding protein